LLLPLQKPIKILKKLYTILLIFLIGFQSFSKVWIVASYQLNKDFIANFLCENKAKPQLQCQGKCQLKKDLDKDAKKQKSSANTDFQFQLFCSQLPSFVFFAVKIVEKPKKFYYLSKKYSFSAKDFFHPPLFY